MAPLIFAIELSSTESTLSATANGPWPFGRTIRPCSIPGSRSWCTYGCVPRTFASVSFRFTGLPTRRYSVTGFSAARPVFGAENGLSPSSAPYVTLFDESVFEETTPARTWRSESGTPSCFAASPSSTARASAAAWRTCGPPVEIEFEPGGEALVGRDVGVPGRELDLLDRQVELLGRDLQQAGRSAR